MAFLSVSLDNPFLKNKGSPSDAETGAERYRDAGGWQPLAPSDEMMEEKNGDPNPGNEWRVRVVWDSVPEPLHPPLPLQTPVLPPTITDQIRLWELERDRLRFTEGEWSLAIRRACSSVLMS
jgi:hypothetical protein